MRRCQEGYLYVRGPTLSLAVARRTFDSRYFSLRRSMRAAAMETIASAATIAASDPGSNAGRGAGGGRLTMSTDTAESGGRETATTGPGRGRGGYDSVRAPASNVENKGARA